MHLAPHEQERLLLSYAADLARRRQARGLRLNLPEATAIVTDHVLEGARDGVLVAELMQSGRTVLTRDDVMDGVPEPTVVAAGARHVAELEAELGPDAVLTSAEQVLLGRRGEEPGRWTGTTRVVRAGRPLLHTTVDLGPGAPAWLPPVAPRAYASTVHVGRGEEPVATGQDAVRLPLPGGWTATAWGTELHRVADGLAAVTTPPERESA